MASLLKLPTAVPDVSNPAQYHTLGQWLTTMRVSIACGCSVQPSWTQNLVIKEPIPPYPITRWERPALREGGRLGQPPAELWDSRA